MTILQHSIAQAAAAGGYQIARSLRFNSADSAYLNRTPASAGNRKTWTWSGWIKRSSSATQILFDCSTNGTNITHLRFQSTTGTLYYYNEVGGTNISSLETTQVFRDFSAWLHVLLAVDTTQATASNRVKLYVNGSQITAFSTASYPSQNSDLMVNSTNAHAIGTGVGYLGTSYFSGYLADVRFIDGQALDPTSFGEFDANTGVWVPKAYTGTYGTNGFWLKFDDNSGTTSTTLGKDSSGNGNNWTPNNFSVTAGAGNDSLVDSPTNYGTDTGAGGEVRGNYCTLNPLSRTTGTLVNGNLQFYGASAWRRCNGTISVTSGKWYWEVNIDNAPSTPRSSTSNYNGFGFGLASAFDSSTAGGSVTDAIIYSDNGYVKNFSGANTDTGSAVANGDVLAVAVDLGANTYTFYKNNVSVATGTIGGTAGQELIPFILSYSNAFGLMSANFGQRPFAYPAPSGFKVLCTTNLPIPTVGATSTTLANKYFDADIYTGTGATQSRTLAFQPDFLWFKIRSGAANHVLIDSVRGTNPFLNSNTTGAEATATDQVTSFNSNGYTLGANTTGGSVNVNASTYVNWAWKAGGTAVTNTSGSISSQVSASTTAGISVVTWTNPASGSWTVGHGLGVAPKMIITKGRSGTNGWVTYHEALGNTKAVLLNTTAAADTNSAYWNNTSPTSSVFSMGSAGVIGASYTMVAYCFAEIAGFSKFGSYTGNGSTDGPFVYCGFRPRFILFKRTDSTGHWNIFDTARNTYNATDLALYPSLSNAETSQGTAGNLNDILSNGFKLRGTGIDANASGGTYIYMAFAEFPFQYARAR